MSVLSAPRFVGQRIRRVEDPRFLTGRGRYVADHEPVGTLHVAFLRSPHAHARITRLDPGPAERAAGVVAVLTGQELEAAQIRYAGFAGQPIAPLAVDEVLYVGHPIAAVVAHSRRQAEDAVELIAVDYEPLPAVVDPLAALAEGAPLANSRAASNVCFHLEHQPAEIDQLFQEADLIVRETFRTHRQTAVPMEPRGILATWEPVAGMLTVIGSSQWAHGLRDGLAAALHLSQSKVRVVVPDVGGGFGVKYGIYPEDVAVAYLATRLGRAVKWVSDRIEAMISDFHARDGIHMAEAAFRKDGTYLAIRDRMVSPAGAFMLDGSAAVLETVIGSLVLPGPYKVQAVGFTIDGVLTNTTPLGTYRGVWGPAATWVQEGLLERAAEKLGLDRVQMRLQNMVRKEDFPYHSPTGVVYDPGSYQESLKLAAERIGYADFAREKAEAARQGRLIGLGIAAFIEPTSLGAWQPEPPTVPYESAVVRMEPSGEVLVQVSVNSHGQGHETTIAQLVADVLGVDFSAVAVRFGDTAAAPFGGGTFGSRSITVGGGAALEAATKLREKVLAIASHLLEAAVEDLEIGDGAVAVKGVPARRVTLGEIGRVAYWIPGKMPPGMEMGLEASSRYVPPPMTFSNGCHAVVVEVDPDTGRVKVLRYVVVEDCGTMVNPNIVEGQIVGGVAQGVGAVFLEEMGYSDDGQPWATTLMDYHLPLASDVPTVECLHLETPSSTPGGMKGMGESAMVAAPAALIGAVEDALSPYGVRFQRLPLTPERVWQAIQAASQPK
ncbi:MAG: xanthine dehydrogenase family protein molybdopterin-binding subunit [Firmicutes bacterium]|nr:xanthine dehydrogenase family protein molybdopterin-binding subunit [Alicyclobacillaceae bacterium]MCL6496273.1 xanthine dehydrogenase family protein molybdopterin-binding subunit [Bacillota bacterium]